MQDFFFIQLLGCTNSQQQQGAAEGLALCGFSSGFFNQAEMENKDLDVSRTSRTTEEEGRGFFQRG